MAKQEKIEAFSKDIKKLFLEKIQTNEWVLLPKLSKEEESELNDFVLKSVEKKTKEKHHLTDGQKEIKRLTNGKKAEFILYKYFDLGKPDLTIGESYEYYTPDVTIYNKKFGIKSSELGKSCLIHKVSKWPEIIIIISEGNYYLSGIATVDNLNSNQDDDLSVIANNKTKSGFTIDGYKSLININDFNYLCKNLHKNCSSTNRTLEEEINNFLNFSKNEKFKKLCEIKQSLF